ncbi:MAG: AtpZ/AtpI family protein [Nitrospirae bacterium]|nr:AtpZ/AtpI family protein [Nitrospirota bacterium]
MNKEQPPEPSITKQLLSASQVGIQIVISTFVGLAMGYGLDKLFGTAPILMLIFLTLGIIAGFVELFRTVKKI